MGTHKCNYCKETYDDKYGNVEVGKGIHNENMDYIISHRFCSLTCTKMFAIERGL